MTEIQKLIIYLKKTIELVDFITSLLIVKFIHLFTYPERLRERPCDVLATCYFNKVLIPVRHLAEEISC